MNTVRAAYITLSKSLWIHHNSSESIIEIGIKGTKKKSILPIPRDYRWPFIPSCTWIGDKCTPALGDKR